MNDQDQYIRDEVARYRSNNVLGMMRGLGFLLVGLVGIFLALSGVMFTPANGNPPSGWLYDRLGPEGTKLAAIALCAVFVLLGVYWIVSRYRNLTVGAEAYEAKIRAESQRR